MFTLLAALVLGLTTSIPGQDTPSDPAAALRTLTIDELIEKLPPIGREARWDEKAKAWVPDPAVSELQRRFGAGERFRDPQWRAAFVRSGAVRMRAQWPATVPLAASLRMPAWLDVARLRMDPRRVGLNTLEGGTLYAGSCGTYAGWQEQRAVYQELGTLPVGKYELDFAAEVRMGESWLGPTPYPPLPKNYVWTGSLHWPVEIVPTILDAMPPVSDEKIDAAVRRSLSVAFSDWADGRTALVVLDPDVCAYPCLAGVALSIEVEVLEGEHVRATFTLRASDADRLLLSSSLSDCERRALAFWAEDSIPILAEKHASVRKVWRLRVRGTTKDILRCWDASTHWAGRFELPLDEAIENEIARAGSQERGPWCWIPGTR